MKDLLDRLLPRASLYAAVTTASFFAHQLPNSYISSYRTILGDTAKSSFVLATLPLSIGDRVAINSHSGRVSSLSPLYLVLEDKDCSTYIPTSTLYNTVIKKFK
ncbi:hypothetical protein NEHOM01_2180 [Nematocida homosporus]|uniref:uncharacterized protein n=1 Tax=Nematocida homosporus TaxID=1912981 RepID=UPI00222030F7|nr:uncharacterized protein NEHOM01_2180 [Nematocida homosporus]KAI5187438.1 hypothetical protein NEHOM01_2180 [Nematocida homosporus]